MGKTIRKSNDMAEILQKYKKLKRDNKKKKKAKFLYIEQGKKFKYIDY